MSHALVVGEPVERLCQEIADVLATKMGYPAIRVSLRHPTVPGVSVLGSHGDPARYGDELTAAATAAVSAGDVARVGGAVCVLIGSDPEIVGSISLADDRPRHLLPTALSALRSVAASLITARDRDRARVALTEQTRTLQAYERTGALLVATLDLDEILDALSREMVEAGVFRSLMVALVDERSGTVTVVRNLQRETDGSIGQGGSGVIGTSYRLDDDNITAQVARTGSLEILRGWDDRYDARITDVEEYSRLTVAYFIPVKKGDRVLAVIATGSQADEQDETLARIADMETLLSQVAVALDHAQLYKETREAREEMRAVMSGAHCLLWHASVTAPPVDEAPELSFDWSMRVFDIEAAQRFMPLDVAAGQTYEVAWHAAKVPEDLAAMDTVAAAALLDGEPGYSQEFRCVDALGVVRWLAEGVRIEPVGPGRWRLIGVCTDITELKRVDQMKEEFISTVSHELRTPLTSILGALELVVAGAAGDIPEKAVPLLTIARNNGRRLTRLVDDILDIDKLESGRVAFDMQVVDLATIVDTAIQANTPFAEGLDVELALDGPRIGVQVDVDAGRFAQLMANLISNAAKFSPSGGAVTVTLEERDGWARVSVTDNGPGIPDSAKADLFDRFTQVDGSTTRHHEGTGLGLAIAKAIVDRLHGRIGMESEEGAGSTFYFDLPARIVRTPGERPATIVVHAVDEAAARWVCTALLREGRVVETVASVDELARCAGASAQAVVVLIEAAEQPGFLLKAIRRLRADPQIQGVPVIVAAASHEHADNAHVAGFILLDSLSRPFDADRLVAAATEAARRRAASAPLILHVGTDLDLVAMSDRALGQFGGVAHAGDIQRARDLLTQHNVDVVLLDMALPPEDVRQALDVVGTTPVLLLEPEPTENGPVDAWPTLRTHPDGADLVAALVDSVLAWDD